MEESINVAVAEKLAHLEHEEWARNRAKPTEQLARRALELLDKAAGNPVEHGDELPKEHRSHRAKARAKQA